MSKENLEKGSNFHVWVVEDDDWYREFLQYSISLNPEYSVKAFSNGKDMLSEITDKPDVITLDYNLPDIDGLSLLKKIKDLDQDIPVLIISKQDKIDTALDLLKNGAYDYFVKSEDLRDKLLNTLQHLRQNSSLKNRVYDLEKEVKRKFDKSSNIIGNSEAMQKVFQLIDKAIQTNIIVSVTGETGTGKEEVAKTIHFNSSFGKGPFVAVNMAAIPRELTESELFGHEKGSFTGAMNTRVGRFEEAANGTIFLDEIGELELSLQAKLLRVLQEREITRVGSNKAIKINCRIIVATHRNLLEEIKEKRFREDLYYRILGLQINIPSLKERGSDILLLAKHFVTQFCKENKSEIKELTKEAQEKLMRYEYPGNVRELKSIVELAAVMSNNQTIDKGDIMLHQSDISEQQEEDRELTLDEYNKKIILNFLKKYDDNVTTVAAKLDIGKSTIYRLLKREQET